MTRIIAGAAGGRRLRVPPGRGTRPSADRTREALFSALAARMELDGAAVLDLYAGSGALGLEALSRGADHALLIESDPRALVVLRANVAVVGLPGAGVLGRPVATVLAEPAPRAHDLLLADPPYALDAGELAAALCAAAAGSWLAPGAVVVLERSSRDPGWCWPRGFVPVADRRYGEATLWYARWGHHERAGATPASPAATERAD
ncbi:MAG: 16S rRNA (guanine(966)-N(2))-methyltransferase RsmD [Sporichthyaceae bacterium]